MSEERRIRKQQQKINGIKADLERLSTKNRILHAGTANTRNNKKQRTGVDKFIERHYRELEEWEVYLNNELQALTIKGTFEPQSVFDPIAPTIYDSNICVGDSVVITNNYKGHRGTLGKVERVSKCFAWIRTLDNTLIQRHKENLKKYN